MKGFLRYAITLIPAVAMFCSPVSPANASTHVADPPQKTYWGPGDDRNYSAYWLTVYEAEFEALMTGAPVIARYGGEGLQTSSFFRSQLKHWWNGTGSPVKMAATDPVAKELHDDPGVQSYFSSREASLWDTAVNAWIIGQAAVIPCGQPGTIERTGVITQQQHREGIGLAFTQFDGVYGIGKPWKADMKADVLIKRKADGSLTYTASGDATLYKWWGWPTDPYSTWSSYDLNFKAWYIEYYGGAKVFPFTIDIGHFDWSGSIPADKAGACNEAVAAHTYDTPIDLTAGQQFGNTGHVSISQNGRYIVVDGNLQGPTTEDTGGGSANGGASYYVPFALSGWNGVNDLGQVDGTEYSCGPPEIFTLGTVTQLTALSGQTPEECGIGSIANNGNIVGDGQSVAPDYYASGWIYDAGTRTYINLKPVGSKGHVLPQTVSSDGSAAGTTDYDSGEFQMAWTNALWSKRAAKPKQIGPAPLESGWVPEIHDMNDKDTIVGDGFYASPGADDGHAFRSNNGSGYADLGALAEIGYQNACDGGVCYSCGPEGGTYSSSSAFSINAVGDIAGTSLLPPKDFSTSNPDCGRERAVIWPNGAAKPTDLNSLIPKNSGWVLTEATGIDKEGDVVGLGTYKGSESAFLLKGPQVLSGTVRFSDGTSPSPTTITITDHTGAKIDTLHPTAAGQWSEKLPAGGYTVTLTNLPKGYSAENGSSFSVDTIDGPVVIDMAVAPDPPACDTNLNAYPDGCATEGFHEKTRETNFAHAATGSLPPAADGAAYHAKLAASGGSPPYVWSLTPGSTLPRGMTLSKAGVLAGKPTSSAVDYVTLQVNDDSSPVEVGYDTVALVAAPQAVIKSLTGQASASTAPGSAITVAGGKGSKTPDTTAAGAKGQGSLMTLEFSSDPVAARPVAMPAHPAYFEVALGPDAGFGTVSVSECGLPAGAHFEYYNAQTKTWRAPAPKPAVKAGCIKLELTAKTTPAEGPGKSTIFAAG